MRYIPYFIFLLFCLPLNAQNGLPTSAGAKGVALNDATVTLQDIYGGWSNPAALAHLERLSFAVFGQQRFALANLNDLSLMAALPTNSGTFGLSVNYFGFDAYNEQKIGLSYARKLFQKISLGVQFDYLNTQITDYGNKGLFTFEVGLQAQLTKTIRLGAFVYNPIEVEIVDNESLPTLLSIGLAYQPSAKIMVAAEVKKDIDLPTRVVLGIDYQLLKQLALRFGVGTAPVNYSFGVGLKLEQLTIDIASKYHQLLGFTPAFSLSYGLNAK